MADALIEYETLTPDQLDDIMAGAKPRAPRVAATAPPRGSASPADGEDAASPGPLGDPAEET